MCCALFHEWQLATPATPQGEGGFHPLYHPKINTRYLLKERKEGDNDEPLGLVKGIEPPTC